MQKTFLRMRFGIGQNTTIPTTCAQPSWCFWRQREEEHGLMRTHAIEILLNAFSMPQECE